MTYRSPEEVTREHLEILGPQLGPVYHALYNDCLWLCVKWHQYVELYEQPERIDLLNRTAGLFFQIVQDTFWDDTLLHLTRLTAPQSSMGKDNLTIQRLPDLIADTRFRAEIKPLVETAVAATAFARDWRNRRIAHRDLELAIKEGAKPLDPASRQQIQCALDGVCRVMERITEYYFKCESHFELITRAIAGDAVSLLYVVQAGIEAQENLHHHGR